MFAITRTVEEADQFLAAYKATTGQPLIVSPAVYAAMQAKGISTEHVKRNDPLPVR